MTDTILSRRNLAVAGIVAGAGLAAAACDPLNVNTQIEDAEQKVTDAINKVQAGVASACSAYGKIVPQANSVLAILAAIINTVPNLAFINPILLTAGVIKQAIDSIVGQVCSSVVPPQLTAAPKSTKVGDITVLFY